MRTLALSIVQRLRDASFAALWAGGCVRDMLLGTPPHDYDVATDATPEQVRKLFRRTLAVGAQFGVIEILGDTPRLHVQVATFRSDGTYSDGRRPDSVRFGTAQEDAQRRDFTINGLFFDPINNEVIDYIGGKNDLNQGIVRAIGNPFDRIHEDKLRMLRAIRFVSRLGFTFDPATAQAIGDLHREIVQVSAERITDELKKMLKHETRSSALEHLSRMGFLRILMTGFDWDCTEAVTFPASSSLPDEVSFSLAWAALLLDMQKQLRPAKPLVPQEVHDAFGTRFRLSSEEIARTKYLLTHLEQARLAHQLPWDKLKPMLADPHRDDLVALLKACIDAWDYPVEGYQYCLDRLTHWNADQLQPAALVTGMDVAAMGIPAGPRYKQLLDAVRTAQLREEIRNRDEALDLLQKRASEP